MSRAIQDIVIWGCGGMGREAQQIVEDINADGVRFNFIGYIDQTPTRAGTLLHGAPVIGDLSWLDVNPSVRVVLALGKPTLRYRLARLLVDEGRARFATLVHPRAWVQGRVTIGEGSILCPGSVVTTDLTLGKHVIINIGATVSHDCALADFTTLAPGVHVCGTVQIGEGCDLGAGSVVIQGLKVGAWSVIGAGAAVIRDLPANVTAVGTPARVIKQRDAGWHL